MLHEEDIDDTFPAPPSAFYVRDFVSAEAAAALAEAVEAAPKPKWEVLANRRLQNWGGIIGKKGSLIRDTLPKWLSDVMETVAPLFPPEAQPNHCLVNEYLPGQGIMPHTDGTAFHPLITTISLGGHTLLDLYRPLDPGDAEEDSSLSSRWAGSLLLEPNSLVVLSGALYADFLHGINPLSRVSVSRPKTTTPARRRPRRLAQMLSSCPRARWKGARGSASGVHSRWRNSRP